MDVLLAHLGIDLSIPNQMKDVSFCLFEQAKQGLIILVLQAIDLHEFFMEIHYNYDIHYPILKKHQISLKSLVIY